VPERLSAFSSEDTQAPSTHYHFD